MPKPSMPARIENPLLRRVGQCTAAVAAVATAVAGAPPAHATMAASTSASPMGSVNAVAALFVGGTSSPRVSDALMRGLWSIWSNGLGLSSASSTQLINVSYPAQLAPFTGSDPLGSSISAGVDNLIALLANAYSLGGHIVVWGISQGALVIDAAQHALADATSPPPPGSLTFVRVADPADRTTGVLNFLPNFFMSKVLKCSAEICTAPTDSPYNNIVVINEYDGFADFPDRPWNILAAVNAVVGMFYRHGQTGVVDLAGVPARDISTTANSLGATTTTYVVSSPFLPLAQLLRDNGVPAAVADGLEVILRPLVDAGYSRNDPAAPPLGALPRAAVVRSGVDVRQSAAVPSPTASRAERFRSAAVPVSPRTVAAGGSSITRPAAHVGNREIGKPAAARR